MNISFSIFNQEISIFFQATRYGKILSIIMLDQAVLQKTMKNFLEVRQIIGSPEDQGICSQAQLQVTENIRIIEHINENQLNNSLQRKLSRTSIEALIRKKKCISDSYRRKNFYIHETRPQYVWNSSFQIKPMDSLKTQQERNPTNMALIVFVLMLSLNANCVKYVLYFRYE